MWGRRAIGGWVGIAALTALAACQPLDGLPDPPSHPVYYAPTNVDEPNTWLVSPSPSW